MKTGQRPFAILVSAFVGVATSSAAWASERETPAEQLAAERLLDDDLDDDYGDYLASGLKREGHSFAAYLRSDAAALRNWGIGLTVAGPLVAVGLGYGVGIVVFFHWAMALAMAAPGMALFTAGVVMWAVGQGELSALESIATAVDPPGARAALPALPAGELSRTFGFCVRF